jgi:hypothetical protein
MSIASGTINSATPGSALRTEIETLMTAHSNWTFIEAVVITTTTWNVWKNHGSGVADPNDFGSDFFIALGVSTASPTVMIIRVFEAWDATGKLAIRPVPTGGQASNADASALATGGVVLSTATALPGNNTLVAAPNTNNYYIALSKNALKYGSVRSDAPTTYYPIYAGIFDSFVTDANEFPLVLAGNANTLGTVQGGNGSTSRHPKRPSVAAVTGNFNFNGATYSTTAGDTSLIDLFHGKAQASRSAMVSTQTGAPQTFGRLRGVLYDCSILSGGSGVTLGLGDTIEIDGEMHWHIPIFNTSCWVDQGAV